MRKFSRDTTLIKLADERDECPTQLFLAMVAMNEARRQYRQERKLSEQLGFDIVDIGGEG